MNWRSNLTFLGIAVRTSKQPSLIRPNRFSSGILFLTVAAAPFPFGSTDPPVVALWCIVLGLGLIAVSPHGLRQEHVSLLGMAVILILGYAIVLHEQLASRPWIASPNPLWLQTAQTLVMPIAPSVSIARNQPYFALGPPLANMLAVTCGFVVCLDRDRANQVFLVLAWSGVAYALYGIAAYLIEPNFVLWREKVAYRDVLTSTFVNRNTAAVYFGSCAILWLLLFLQQFRRALPQDSIHWMNVPRALPFKTKRSMALSLAMLFLCFTAMLLTSSRAGIVVSLLSLVLAFGCFFYRGLSRRGGIAAALAVGGLALLLLEVLGGNVSGRFDAQGFSDEGRLAVYRSTLKMIADYPWFGTGLGTFIWNFPAYRSADVSMWGVWDRAHSTPLEIAAELGLPLAGLITLAWLIVLAVLVRGIRLRRRDRILPVGAFAVAILGLTHSAVDFSLQISGYAIPVFILLGAGLAQSFRTKTTKNAEVEGLGNLNCQRSTPSVILETTHGHSG